MAPNRRRLQNTAHAYRQGYIDCKQNRRQPRGLTSVATTLAIDGSSGAVFLFTFSIYSIGGNRKFAPLILHRYLLVGREEKEREERVEL